MIQHSETRVLGFLFIDQSFFYYLSVNALGIKRNNLIKKNTKNHTMTLY